MSIRKISDVEAFKKECDEARRIRLTEEDIKIMDELIRIAKIEEMENEKSSKCLRQN